MKQGNNQIVFTMMVCMVMQLFCLSSMHADTSSACQTNCYISRNLYLPRAFSSYSMHEIIHNGFLVGLDHQKEDHKAYAAFTFEYMQNFGSNSCCRSNVGVLPFWSGTNSMTIGNNDGKADIDAYQFGLGNVEVHENCVAGAIHLCPKIQHIGGDLMFYYTHLNNKPSMYFKIHVNGQPSTSEVKTYYCEPLARINKSQDPVRLTGTPPTVTSVGVVLPEGIADARKSENRIPVKFSDSLDICGAQSPAVISGKLFTQLEHTWKSHCYAPSIGVLSGVEFASNNSMPWLWSVGLQGRLSF